jgi:hypothetical protein
MDYTAFPPRSPIFFSKIQSESQTANIAVGQVGLFVHLSPKDTSNWYAVIRCWKWSPSSFKNRERSNWRMQNETTEAVKKPKASTTTPILLFPYQFVAMKSCMETAKQALRVATLMMGRVFPRRVNWQRKHRAILHFDLVCNCWNITIDTDTVSFDLIYFKLLSDFILFCYYHYNQ